MQQQQHLDQRQAAPSDTVTRPGLRLVSFKTVRKGALIGFATVELPIGLEIRDCPVLQSNGKAWAGLPGRPQIRDDRVIRDERGRIAYVAVNEWRDRRLRDAFSDRIVELVRRNHPEAFTEQGVGP